MNRLLFADNLVWLRDKTVFPDASVDLEYLDPPFNSKRKCNFLIKLPTRPRQQQLDFGEEKRLNHFVKIRVCIGLWGKER